MIAWRGPQQNHSRNKSRQRETGRRTLDKQDDEQRANDSRTVLNPNLTLRRYAMMDDLTTLMEIWVDAADAGMPRHPPTTADGTTLRLT